MQASANLLLHTQLKTTALSTVTSSHPPPNPLLPQPRQRTNTVKIGRPKIRSASRASWQDDCPIAADFNLYELLGVEASSDKARIKEAYRALQKRCHPDIAGPTGHDMAIVLNEAYALLSDPNSRMAYDKELAKVADFQGYTGRPIYSVWLGSESEQRAVFVDEVKCVGCLKCALFADKTFAIESVYGRARVVAQWADPEYKIQEAIGTCPVDCISIVERDNLAALEFIMSKQPRGKVRIGVGNTVGARTSDIFDEVEKFQARYAQHKTTTTDYSKSRETERASRASAIQAIQMISNWLYWQSPIADASTPPAVQNSQSSPRKHVGPSVKKLKAAAAARKQATTTLHKQMADEYWEPTVLALPDAAAPDFSSKPVFGPAQTRKISPSIHNFKPLGPEESSGNPLRSVLPLGMAVVAAGYVRLELVEPASGLKDHIGGSLAVAIVNSSWMQVVLAGFTWYLIGIYAVELMLAFRRK
ncbi:DNAJ heat shock N-terminal domain-containing protein [Striga hermonthica]|uniref:DNAJ heat shock N-terminal domain-containing protein n=1 Tax=Striga hermonthica TaxID=68872 RepID=A0A9N7NSB7_STRHE|nr:DNAJ heat shock N-terminal domain-containing protein [Striga hermonthica]